MSNDNKFFNSFPNQQFTTLHPVSRFFERPHYLIDTLFWDEDESFFRKIFTSRLNLNTSTVKVNVNIIRYQGNKRLFFLQINFSTTVFWKWNLRSAQLSLIHNFLPLHRRHCNAFPPTLFRQISDGFRRVKSLWLWYYVVLFY